MDIHIIRKFEFVGMDARYAVALMEIKERGVVSIEKERRMTLIVAEFHMKLGVYSHVRSFLLIELPFSLEIVSFLDVILEFVGYFDHGRAIAMVFINCIFENILIFR
jgi:hypothetical protein